MYMKVLHYFFTFCHVQKKFSSLSHLDSYSHVMTHCSKSLQDEKSFQDQRVTVGVRKKAIPSGESVQNLLMMT
jgi:hypothetical protein